RRGGARQRGERVAQRRDALPQGGHPLTLRLRRDGQARAPRGLRRPDGHLRRPGRPPRRAPEVRRPRRRPRLSPQRRAQPAPVARGLRPRRPPEGGALMIIAQAVEGLPPVTGGDDLAALLAPALRALTWPDGSVGTAEGDVVVVASKVVAKAERRLVAARTREELEEVIAGQTVRVVAERARPDGSTLRIVQNPQGLVLAAAGVDTSDVPLGTALLLPEDPDASARALRRGLDARLGVR